MKRLPKILPEYTITPVSDPPFECRWEELMGWFIVPKLGEKLNWAIYDHPERVITEVFEMEVIGRAVVHGIEGVEIVSEERNAIDSEHRNADVTRKFVVQLTDTHSRILAEEHPIDGIKHFHTFLDGDAFIGNWGFGEDNCGNEINLRQCGSIHRDGSNVTTENAKVLLDVVGRYTVTLGGKTYDTICVMDIGAYETGTVSEQFIDRDGRTVIWRRFNRNDWRFKRYGQLWSEKFPENERLLIKGEIYVHWYDCITDYVI